MLLGAHGTLRDIVQSMVTLKSNNPTSPSLTTGSGLPESASRNAYGPLPLEILIYVLADLEVPDILRCRAVSEIWCPLSYME